jgi:hypothetical protein
MPLLVGTANQPGSPDLSAPPRSPAALRQAAGEILRRNRTGASHPNANKAKKFRRDFGREVACYFIGVWDTVGSLLDLFTPAECANYFKAAGYDPDLNRTCSRMNGTERSGKRFQNNGPRFRIAAPNC